MITNDTPPPRRRRKTHRVTLRAVIGFTERLRSRGLTEELLAAATQNKMILTLPEETVAFIRDFLDAHEAKRTDAATLAFRAAPLAMAEAMAPYCEAPYECFIR